MVASPWPGWTRRRAICARCGRGRARRAQATGPAGGAGNASALARLVVIRGGDERAPAPRRRVPVAGRFESARQQDCPARGSPRPVRPRCRQSAPITRTPSSAASPDRARMSSSLIERPILGRSKRSRLAWLAIFGAARCGTGCYAVGVGVPEITQRDLRSRSREIMDAVEHGQSFTVTRDGHQIGQLVPMRRRRRFVSRQEFAAMSRNAPDADLAAFRADQDTAADHEATSAYDR